MTVRVDAQEIAEAMARRAVETAAPDVLPLFDDIAADYRARGDALTFAVMLLRCLFGELLIGAAGAATL